MSSQRLQTAIKFTDHYATHDNEVLNTLLADDLIFEFSPMRSLDTAKSLDKAGYIEFKRGMNLIQSGYPLHVKKYIEGESSNSTRFQYVRYCQVTFQGAGLQSFNEHATLIQKQVVVVWCTGSPQWRDELKDYEVFTEEQWAYVGEFIFMLTMDEEGKKITKIVEFVDSKGTDNKLLPLAQRAMGNLQRIQKLSGNYI